MADLELLAQGREADVYALDDTTVLRRYRNPAHSNTLMEAKVMAYLAEHGEPAVLAELALHTCLQLVTPAGDSGTWRFDGPHGEEAVALPPARFKVNVAEALAVGLREGMGIGVLPLASALPHLRAGTLVRLFPQYTKQHLQIFAVYASRRYLDAKIRTWLDFMRAELPKTLQFDEASLRQFVAAPEANDAWDMPPLLRT